MNDPTQRSSILPGMTVSVVQKQDQKTGKRTMGVVAEVLTKSAAHSNGIKVKLTSGVVGRVKEIVLASSHTPQSIPLQPV